MGSLATQPLLEASGVTFAYGKRPVLRGVGVSVGVGEVVALIGPNGCGKSTLLRVLMGQLRGAGSVRWEGQKIEEWRRGGGRQFARKVAFLPQHPTWVEGLTVLQAVGMGRYPHLGVLSLESARDEAVAREAAMAMGLETELGRRMEELSGGQRQRVFLARCLAQEPGALLLDEPDTFLDLRHAAVLAGTLRRLARDRKLAVVFASHDLHLAGAVADRVVMMNDGRVVAEGTPRAVLTPENIATTYGVQAVVWEEGKAWGVGVVY